MLKFLAVQKFRLDAGNSVASYFMLIFTLTAASDKITTVTGLPAKVIIPVGFFGVYSLVWLFGLLMDKSGFLTAYQAKLNTFNEMLKSLTK